MDGRLRDSAPVLASFVVFAVVWYLVLLILGWLVALIAPSAVAEHFATNFVLFVIALVAGVQAAKATMGYLSTRLEGADRPALDERRPIPREDEE